MNRIILALTFTILVTHIAVGQACPKVTYLNTTATIQSLVTSVNCLVDTVERDRSSRAEGNGRSISVDAFQVRGMEHTRAYGQVVFAVLALPDGDISKSALAMPNAGEATVAGTTGADCKAKINSDNTVDAQCKLAGAALYVVYRN
jgi:hypothetical protein